MSKRSINGFFWMKASSTVAISASGAKASLNAVKATSTAGASGGSALSELEQGASIFKKAGALAKDMASSTKNNASVIKTLASNTKEALQIQKLRKQVSNIKGTPTEEEMSLIRELQIREGNLGNQDAINIANRMQEAKNVSVVDKVKNFNPSEAVKSLKGSVNKTSVKNFIKWLPP